MTTPTPQMAEAVRVGCQAGMQRTCSYPNCGCTLIPRAIQAAVRFAVKDAATQLASDIVSEISNEMGARRGRRIS